MITVSTLNKMKQAGEKIAMLTCYEASFASLMSDAGVDMLLVGDSLGMTVQGHDSTLPVTLADMVYHTRAVARGNKNAMIVTDLSFGSFQQNKEQAFAAAVELMQAGAHMVKLEGGVWMAETTEFLQMCGIPVCAHIGLTPQSVYQLGGFKVQAKTSAAADQLLQDALALQEAGASMLVIEAVPMHVGKFVTEHVKMVTIGIGAGKDTDGQVLVLYDMLDVFPGKKAKFVKNFMQGKSSIAEAVAEYVAQVKSGEFPQPEHGFTGGA